MTGDLYRFVEPDLNRPGKAASKRWQMAYRFHRRQKTYSIGPYDEGNGGMLHQLDAEFPGQFFSTYVEAGPSVWRVEIGRHEKAVWRSVRR